MKKSILVFDTPDSCNECCLSMEHSAQLNSNICRAKEKYSFNPDSSTKPGWCPLKEIPEKEKSEDSMDEYDDGFVAGWNACIDKILDTEEISEGEESQCR